MANLMAATDGAFLQIIPHPTKPQGKPDGDQQHEGPQRDEDGVDRPVDRGTLEAACVEGAAQKEARDRDDDQGVLRKALHPVPAAFRHGAAAVVLRDGEARGVVGELLEDLVDGHERKAGLSQEQVADERADGADVGEGAAAEKGARFLRGKVKKPCGPKGEHAARDDGEEADEGQGHEGRVPDAHDPGGAHDGHGVHEEKRRALEPLAQRVHRDGKTDETPGREHAARRSPREAPRG